ncbi:transcription factor FSS1 [Fusarium heterosporum]|uniref:Transcription factor FSS1 n=1 Tax=Fusarium heterosporum TaxID=42747 RepID=A0A8H5WHP3_FUSHE|nr:transcription factor FSS1 [Fusarium heterosporum]
MTDSDSKVKRKRARGPKVRSGCLTWTPGLHRKQSDTTPPRPSTTSKILVPAVSELASSLNAMSFWHAYALPLSQTSKPIKAAIGALGGAHKAFKLQTQTDPFTQSLAQSYEMASVQQYNNAIRVMHEYMNSEENNLQVILTCCLIFICTENLYGRYANVTRHLESAFSLLNTCERWNPAGTHYRGEFGDKRKDDGLRKFMDNIGPSLCGLASDLFFYMGDSHSSKLVSELQQWLERQDPINLQEPGAPFFSAQAAASFLTRVETICDVEMYAQCQLCLAQGAPCGKTGLACRRFDNGLESEPFYHYWSARYRIFKQNFDPQKASESELFRFKVLELEEITWQATFKLASINDDLEVTDCVEILNKAESIIDLSQRDNGHVFTFQANLCPPIAYVIISCPDEKIQWEGVRLLRRLGRKEGVWDSRKMADIYTDMIKAKTSRLVTWEEIPDDVPRLAKLLGSVRLETPTVNAE